MLKLTDLDRRIISRLNQDARTSSAEIARELNINERTIRYRVQRMISEGVLKPVAVVNPDFFGYNLVVDIFCEVEVDHRDQVIQSLCEMPQVSYIAYSTGDQDISIQAFFKDSQEMHAFITRKISSQPGVRRTRTILVPQIVKDSYQWMPPPENFVIGEK